MTKAEWYTSVDPEAMLPYIERQSTPRQKRLFLGACCRRLRYIILNDDCRALIEMSDRFADGECSVEELYEASCQVKSGRNPLTLPWKTRPIWAAAENIVRSRCFRLEIKQAYEAVTVGVAAALDGRPFETMSSMFFLVMSPLQLRAAYNDRRDEITLPDRQAQANLIRCIFGRPYNRVRLHPEWRTDTVLTLAQQMYDTRDFSAMPILADALQDADCEDEAILTHCRGCGLHTRGCHLIDAILNKA